MFKKFLDAKICRDVLFWLLDHNTGDYEAAVIAYDLGISDISRFCSYIYILENLDVVSVDDSSQSLRIIFNEDSLIVQSFKNLRDTFDNEAYRSSAVCEAFITLEEEASNLDILEVLREQFFALTQEEKQDFFTFITNYKEFEYSDDPTLRGAQMDLADKLNQLDQDGKLDLFIDFVKQNLYI